MTADFEVSVRALEDDPANGIEGARGALGAAPTEADWQQVRRAVYGHILQAEGFLPHGWELDVAANVVAAGQQEFVGDPSRAPAQPAPAPPDRLGTIETALCRNCAGVIVNQGDGVWVHQQPCGEPAPADERDPLRVRLSVAIDPGAAMDAVLALQRAGSFFDDEQLARCGPLLEALQAASQTPR